MTESLKHLDKMYPSGNNGGAHISVTSSQQAGGGMDTKPKDLGDLKKWGWLRRGAVVSSNSDDPNSIPTQPPATALRHSWPYNWTTELGSWCLWGSVWENLVFAFGIKLETNLLFCAISSPMTNRSISLNANWNDVRRELIWLCIRRISSGKKPLANMGHAIQNTDGVSIISCWIL